MTKKQSRLIHVWKGINTYSKSLQKLLGVERIDDLPKSQNPHINFSTTECGIKKCTHVRGMFNTSFGEACINNLGAFDNLDISLISGRVRNTKVLDRNTYNFF